MKYKILFALCYLYITSFSQPKNTQPPAPLLPVPTAQQLAWHEMEMNAFLHFTTNTFTGKEWGYGDEQPAIFNPSALNAAQWIKVLKAAGCKGAIFTTKHHDGFCLWPSKYTDHSVKNSAYKNGNGDIVKEVSDACKKYGLKFGVYLSPWDRNRADYGTASYITYYRNQLKELFTGYGPIFEMWFDGANGGDGYYGGTKEKRKISGATYYGWPTTLQFVQSIQPQVLFFSDAGPDIRWVGNESGRVNETNWNTITPDTLYAGKAGIEHLLSTGSDDGTKWVPAECDVSIRPGWFYHAQEDAQVKTAQELFDIYLKSVGRGAVLLLNVPPDRRGRIHENDVASLTGFKKILDKTFAKNLAKNAGTTASSYRHNDAAFAAKNITDGKKETYWATDDGVTTGSFTIDIKKPQTVSYIALQEYIALGQRVKAFSVDVWKNDKWQKIAGGTTIGYKRIIKITPTITHKIKVNIEAAKVCPVISNAEVY